MTNVLVLNASYTPHAVVSLEKAFGYIIKGSAEVVEEKGTIGTVRGAIGKPIIVRLKKYHNVPRRNVRYTRAGVLKRDNYTCVYCGQKVKDDGATRPMSATIDHIVAQSVCEKRGIPANTWTNTVTSCKRCNQRKGDRSLHEANMNFKNPNYVARAPRTHWTLVATGNIPEEWKLYMQDGEDDWKRIQQNQTV
jgi:5-methylcytosine-specific restriction endonuclease McrA